MAFFKKNKNRIKVITESSSGPHRVSFDPDHCIVTTSFGFPEWVFDQKAQLQKEGEHLLKSAQVDEAALYAFNGKFRALYGRMLASLDNQLAVKLYQCAEMARANPAKITMLEAQIAQTKKEIACYEADLDALDQARGGKFPLF